MNPRDVVLQNIEFSGEHRVGFNFTNGRDRRNDFVSVGCRPDVQSDSWVENQFEYY